MDFPLTGLMDESACYRFLVGLLHPQGLACPNCGSSDLRVHRRKRDPVLDYQCPDCGRVFNAWTGTLLHKTHLLASEWVLLLRGFAQGTTTARLARELGRDRVHLLEVRHRLQELAQCAMNSVLPDAVVEVDEAYQNAGEKRRAAHRPGRPAAAEGA